MIVYWYPNLCYKVVCYKGTALYIWALTRKNLTLLYANKKCATQPAHPHSLVSTFVIHFLESIVVKATTVKPV